VHYPDFLHLGAGEWWRRQLAAFHDMAPWDGLWIDMNEASNFCTGEVSPMSVRVPANRSCFTYSHTQDPAFSRVGASACHARIDLIIASV